MSYRLNYRLKRFIIKWRRWRARIDSKIGPEGNKLTQFEEKAIRLWKLCLRDKDTKLAYNSMGIRQLEKGNLFLIFKPSGSNDFIMTIMDITVERKSVFEIHIPIKHSGDVCDYFDVELGRRMRETESAKRSMIGDDLDRLLNEQTREINRQKRSILNINRTRPNRK